MSAKKKVTKEILTTDEYFERISEETSSNLAAKLTPREKFQSLVTNERRFVPVQNKMAPVLNNFYEIGHHVSRSCLRI